MADFPQDFRCPISMELMIDPVTISTGVTYERKSIERWLFTYKKRTCPATMQRLHNYEITPNHILKSLILAWHRRHSPSSSYPPSPPPSAKHDELLSLLNAVESSTPFKVTSLKKLRSIVQMGDGIVISDFKRSRGVEILVGILVHVLSEDSDFVTFTACEETLGVLNDIFFSEEDDGTFNLLSTPDCIKSMAILLQKGSTETRFFAVSMFDKMCRADFDWNFFLKDQGIDFFKSLLEIVSDEICRGASSRALQVLIEMMNSSKKSRLKAIEAGGICTLVELLPDSNRSKCEKMLLLIKMLCECAEGRVAFIDHGLGIAAVSKKILHVSDAATRVGVKILWLISSFHPTNRVAEEMLVVGSAKRLVALLHVDGRSSVKERAVKILKMHGNSWRRCPCSPIELKAYLEMA